MSKQRLIDTCFWDDPYVMQLNPSEKLLFLYLLTNPLTAICGVYEISIKRMTFDTGFGQDVIEKILAKFQLEGKCLYKDGWLAIRNWLKHQKQGSPKVQKGIEVQLEIVPTELANYVRAYGIDTLSPELSTGLSTDGAKNRVSIPFDTVSHLNSNTNTNLNLNRQPVDNLCTTGDGAGSPSEKASAPSKSKEELVNRRRRS